MNELINKVLQWGLDKGITGPNGKATPITQAKKMREEALETIDAVYQAELANDPWESVEASNAIIDGIGDVTVTLILLAERCGMTLEQCLQAAYDVISRRTGRMINGTFVRDK